MRTYSGSLAVHRGRDGKTYIDWSALLKEKPLLTGGALIGSALRIECTIFNVAVHALVGGVQVEPLVAQLASGHGGVVLSVVWDFAVLHSSGGTSVVDQKHIWLALEANSFSAGNLTSWKSTITLGSFKVNDETILTSEALHISPIEHIVLAVGYVEAVL